MSNSASIAAAKRRRGASQNPPVATSSSASSSRNINRVQSEPTLEKGERTQQRISPIQILGMHENRLEFLERQHNNMAMALNQYPNPNEEKIVTLKDLEDFRQAFQKLSSTEKKVEGGSVNVQQIKKEVSEEFTKSQLTNLATKKDVDSLIGSMRKELLNENFKSLEDKINALKISNSEVSSSTKTSSKEIEEVTKTLTKKIEDSIPKNIVTSKQLDNVKSELNKKVDGMQIPKDYITSKELVDLKNEFNKKIDSLPKNTTTVLSDKPVQEEKLSLTAKARLDTLENKVKALEAIILNFNKNK
jgi:tetrahydromethanopterin S-methyltransferase subunit G